MDEDHSPSHGLPRWDTQAILVLVGLVVLCLGAAAIGLWPVNRATLVSRYISSRPQTGSRVAQGLALSQVVLGMTPTEASLAGGSAACEVEADQKWGRGTDPRVIRAAQTSFPDNSHIRMHFFNATQFNTRDPVGFTAVIEHGRVVQITRE